MGGKHKKRKKAPTLNIGQPTAYRDCHAEMAYKLCLLGAIDDTLADFFNVTPLTINNWKKKHPEFKKALKEGKIQADAEVAKALFHRAKGYSHPDVHISSYKGNITVTELTKYYPPDTAAAFIWLKNRAGWRDDSNISIEDKRLPKEEIEQVRKHLRAQFTDRLPDSDVRGEIIDVQATPSASAVPSLAGEVS